MKIINLTPHEINIEMTPKYMTDSTLTLPAADNPARVDQKDVEVDRLSVTDDDVNDRINALPVYESRFGEVNNLPEPREEVAYVVSRIVATACPERDDLYVPAKTFRDNEGRIAGCRGLAKV